MELEPTEAPDDEPGRLRALAGVARTVRGRLRRSDVLVRDGDRRFAALIVNAGEADARAVGAAVQEALAGRATVAVSAFGAASTPERILAEAQDALRAAATGA